MGGGWLMRGWTGASGGLLVSYLWGNNTSSEVTALLTRREALNRSNSSSPTPVAVGDLAIRRFASSKFVSPF